LSGKRVYQALSRGYIFRVFRVLLAFRNGGGPIYWLCLETVRSHQSEDEAILKSVAASFKQIHWE